MLEAIMFAVAVPSTNQAAAAAQAGLDAPGSPGLVHYLPILTTLISVSFIAVLLARASKRAWAPHLLWWAVGVFFYGVGTALESSVTLFGNSPTLFTLWYWAGAILGGYPLATGTVYLLLKRPVAHAFTAVSGAVVVFASIAVFLSPVLVEELQPHRPSGTALGWQWIRWMTPFINLYAAVFLIGGALWSTLRWTFDRNDPKRAVGTGLIALGGLLPGIGGSMAKADIVEALYIGELVGLIFIWWGYEVCIRRPAPKLDEQDQPAAEANTDTDADLATEPSPAA